MQVHDDLKLVLFYVHSKILRTGKLEVLGNSLKQEKFLLLRLILEVNLLAEWFDVLLFMLIQIHRFQLKDVLTPILNFNIIHLTMIMQD